ncbi:MAG: ExbD/TolR family protein [Panacagrimonas sp.]
MRLRRHYDHSTDTGIDLAPMLDFVLNLLIFFIITAVFIKQVGITAGGLSSAPQEKTEAGNIIIAIKCSGEIVIKSRIVDLRAVRANVERLRSEQPEAAVVVATERDTPNGMLVRVMDQIRQGGVYGISVSPSNDTCSEGG